MGVGRESLLRLRNRVLRPQLSPAWKMGDSREKLLVFCKKPQPKKSLGVLLFPPVPSVEIPCL